MDIVAKLLVFVLVHIEQGSGNMAVRVELLPAEYCEAKLESIRKQAHPNVMAWCSASGQTLHFAPARPL